MSRSEHRRADDAPEARGHPLLLHLYAGLVILPLLVYLAWSFIHNPSQLKSPEAGSQLLLWAIAIASVDLLPVPAGGSMSFSLSFPLELSAALLYPPPVAALVAFVGSSDIREFKGQISPLKAIAN